MLKFVLCDDNVSILNRLSKMLETIFIDHSYDAEVSCQCTTSDELLSYLNNNIPDVILLDINLKSNLSGLDLAEKIRKINKKLYLIFTTGHLEYSLMAYQFKTFDYIAKPITMERLEDTVSRLFDDITANNKLIKVGTTRIMVKEDDILYIKKDGMKIVYKSDNRIYESYCSFKQVQDTLPENFIRCHKSYIVNIHNIYSIKSNKNVIEFKNNDSCAIGPKYKNNLMEVLKNYGNFTNNLERIDYSEHDDV